MLNEIQRSLHNLRNEYLFNGKEVPRFSIYVSRDAFIKIGEELESSKFPDTITCTLNNCGTLFGSNLYVVTATPFHGEIKHAPYRIIEESKE